VALAAARAPAGLVALAALAACASSSSPKSPRREDAGAGARADAAVAVAPAAGGGPGAIDVKVEWPDAPAALRASPGRNPCGEARRPAASIHTLHGVADAVVLVEGVAGGKPAPAASPVELVVRGCRVEPRVAVAPRAGVDVVIASADRRRHELTVVGLGDPSKLAAATAGEPVPVASVALPIVGHEVALAAPAPTVLRMTTAADPSDPAWIVVPPHPYVAVTDDTGAAHLGDVPAGTYAVVAWLPSAAKLARGKVTVAPGAAASVVLSLAP